MTIYKVVGSVEENQQGILQSLKDYSNREPVPPPEAGGAREGGYWNLEW